MIESASLDDIDAIVRIEQQTFINPWSEKTLRQCITQQQVVVYKNNNSPESDNGVIAFLIYQQTLDEVCLLQIAVDLSFQRQGMGSWFLRTWLESLNETVNTVWLEVRESNLAAQALYVEQGFQKVSVRKNYYKTPAHGREAALVFSLDLNP